MAQYAQDRSEISERLGN